MVKKTQGPFFEKSYYTYNWKLMKKFWGAAYVRPKLYSAELYITAGLVKLWEKSLQWK